MENKQSLYEPQTLQRWRRGRAYCCPAEERLLTRVQKKRALFREHGGCIRYASRNAPHLLDLARALVLEQVMSEMVDTHSDNDNVHYSAKIFVSLQCCVVLANKIKRHFKTREYNHWYFLLAFHIPCYFHLCNPIPSCLHFLYNLASCSVVFCFTYYY